MQVREVVKALARQLEDGLTVSISPDHPYLLQGPDVLAGGNGKMLAIFVMKTVEQRAPVHLMVRAVLSRLALPAHTIFVLVTSEGSYPVVSPERSQQALRGLFPFAVNPRDHFDWQSIIDHTTPDVRAYHQLREMQSQAFELAERRFMQSIVPTDGDGSAVEPASLVHELLREHRYSMARHHQWLARAGRVQSVEGAVADRYVPHRLLGSDVDRIEEAQDIFSLEVRRNVLAFTEALRPPPAKAPRDQHIHLDDRTVASASGKLSSAKVMNLLGVSVQDDYQLIDGPPYFSARVHRYKVRLLLVRRAPEPRQDPQKMLRAFALGGWVVARAESARSALHLVDTALEALSGGLDEEE